MSVSDVLRPGGSDYYPFLHAEVGEDTTGATVTVLSAFARLGFDPWIEARELALLGRDAAQIRLKAHLATISGIPALGLASDNVATKLVSLLPKRASQDISQLPEAKKYKGRRLPMTWALTALVATMIFARIFYLAHLS